MTADPAGWPDPARPGVPLHPERDGWHWVAGMPRAWLSKWQQWDAAAAYLTPEEMARRASVLGPYLGPCRTDADLAAERAAAAEAMREACAARLEEMRLEHNAAMIGIWHTMDTSLAYGDGAEAIRALPIPSASALSERDERMREEGRREEREACAALCDHDAALLRQDLNFDLARGVAHAAAAIRARSEGKGDE